MQSVQEAATENQAAPPTENTIEVQLERKIGIEVVQSADLPSAFFRGWCAASYSVRDARGPRRLKRVIK